jgi:hypothetical protein
MKVFILVVALLVAACSAQLTSTDINTIVSLHNSARTNAVPVPQTPLPPVVWDNTLAADAQSWASQCKQNLSPKFYGTVYGENALIMSRLDVTRAVNQWLSQRTSYNFADGSCSSSTGCGNFQQIVSRTSTSVGCGVATCSWGVFFVCDYKAFSQYSGVLPYIPAGGQTSTSGTASSSASSGYSSASSAVASSAVASSAAASSSGSSATTSSPSGYATIDYRGSKAVLGVHDQKQCGSCWAFSSTAIIEGALGKRGLTLPLLSDQNVLDCSGGGSCDGGWTATALRGMITKGGINSNAEYPYTQAQGSCRYNAATSQGAITKNGQTKGDFASMYNALVTYGPVGIAVYADNTWQSYRSGVLSADYTSVNHAVTIVGYDASLDAWIVKNSWGSSWGMSGYAYLSVKHPYAANVNGAMWAQ